MYFDATRVSALMTFYNDIDNLVTNTVASTFKMGALRSFKLNGLNAITFKDF
jgi:hypothetical protein